ncbi:uncharacterized protein K444DRAFT_626204 [Hyaloscypha bicolor E]|uniref:Uncharacterized protein n=1 Tax=Hyaloscypha bicolor E TaxID=1095630 RepID=A0A2J6TLR2_9HELO|nr:uncharacterized protein K444DRAFT_626204 [Hyaloscypha bicolor E]PMD63961.1 hypothetical protein K444DRAFT_626204 [Hyaloscypha bicolor E]
MASNSPLALALALAMSIFLKLPREVREKKAKRMLASDKCDADKNMSFASISPYKAEATMIQTEINHSGLKNCDSLVSEVVQGIGRNGVSLTLPNAHHLTEFGTEPCRFLVEITRHREGLAIIIPEGALYWKSYNLNSEFEMYKSHVKNIKSLVEMAKTQGVYVELQAPDMTIIWKFSSSPAEIISVEVILPIISEKGTNKKKKVDGQISRRQFSIKYKVFGIPITLGGTYVSRLDETQFIRSGQLGACKESRAIYLKAKLNFVRLFKKTGRGNIWFNADIDTIAIPRRTRFNLNQLRQRRRPKMVFFRGFENIRRVVFEEEADKETTLGLLGEQIAIDFAESIVDIEEQLFEVPSASCFGQVELGKEVNRAGADLQKVNGTVFKEGVGEGVKMHFFPLGENYLEDQIHEYEEDGAST